MGLGRKRREQPDDVPPEPPRRLTNEEVDDLTGQAKRLLDELRSVFADLKDVLNRGSA